MQVVLTDAGLISGGWEEALEEGKATHSSILFFFFFPLQYSCLKNPMDRGTGQAMVHRVAKSHTQLKQLSTHAHGCLIVQCKSGGKLIIWESGMQGI